MSPAVDPGPTGWIVLPTAGTPGASERPVADVELRQPGRRLTGPCGQHPRIRSHVTALRSGNQDNGVRLDFPESTVIEDDRVSRVNAPC